MTKGIVMRRIVFEAAVFTLMGILISPVAFAQYNISKTREDIILLSSKRTVESYARFVELIASGIDQDDVNTYKAELMKTIEKDSINVFNDLIPKADRQENFADNIDQISTYLDDINSHYLEGVKITFKNFRISPVFIDTIRLRLFIKIVASREIDGVFHYKDQKKQNTATEQIDFYVGIQGMENNALESRIFSISEHQENEKNFVAIKVVEKTAPIKFTNIVADSIYRRKTNYAINWEGGEIFERLKLEIYRTRKEKTDLVHTVDIDFVNDNELQYMMPKSIKAGKKNQYYYEIKKLSSEEAPIKSNTFYVKRKYPWTAQAGTAVVIIAGLGFVIYKAFIEDKSTASDLPEPPFDTP